MAELSLYLTKGVRYKSCPFCAKKSNHVNFLPCIHKCFKNAYLHFQKGSDLVIFDIFQFGPNPGKYVIANSVTWERTLF